jgi:hypothetical protein
VRLKRGFIVFVVVWAVLTLPGFILGLVAVGGDISAMVPPFAEVHTVDLVAWVMSMLWLFSPVLLAPFMLRRKP